MVKKGLFDKALLKQILHIGVPVMIQQILLTTFGIVDSIMVGSIDYAISAVGIAAQIEGIMMTVGFGVNSGIAIYISQFYGNKDVNKIKKVFSLMVVINIINSLIFTFLGLAYGKEIISLFNSNTEVVSLGVKYLNFAALSYLFSATNFAFSFVYRNIQKTKVIMYTSAISMAINVTFNYLLIYGIGIFPEMGVAGAGVATLLSNIVGVTFNLIYAIKTKQMFIPSISHIIGGLKAKFFAPILWRSLFLIFNEALFSIGGSLYIFFLNKNSAINPDPFEGYKIAEITVSFMFAITIALSSSATAILGQELGANEYEKAKSHGKQFMLLGLIVAIFLAVTNTIIAEPLVLLFNKNDSINAAAISILYVFSLRLFLRVFIVLVFSSLRAGGKSGLVAFLDAGIMWIVGIPLAVVATYVFDVNNIALLFLIIQIEAVVRFIVGIYLFFRYSWIKNLTHEVKD